MARKIIIVNIINLFIISFAEAGSDIYVLNNTDEEIRVFSSGDSNIINANDVEVVNPYQYYRVANVSRYSNIEAGKSYYFFFFLGYEHLTLALKLDGNVFGSNMSFTLADPETTHASGFKSDRNVYSDVKGEYQYYYKASYTGGYDNVTFVVDKKKAVKPTERDSLKVLTYNVWMLPHVGSNMDIRATRIAEEVKDHDIVFMQEVFRRKNEEDIYFTMNEHFDYISDKLDGGGSNTYDGGVVTFSKFPIITQSQYVFNNCIGTDCAADKGVLYTKILKDDHNFHLLNLHLGSWNSRSHRDVRILQIYEIKAFLEQLSIPDGEPIILGGDFNIAKYKFPLDFSMLLDSLNLLEPELTGPLKYSYDPLVNINLAGGDAAERERLDYLLYVDNGAIASSTAKIEVLRNFDAAMWGGWDLSDHHAVSSTFYIR
ncbi:sphingomyelin phosphodiesterase [Vibrio sp. AND4]|uniref:sphingomyelin phosphodiesterase n=1 Tax=Vibrio sp. AND4 TaxID=314289 RepID=UPI00015F0F20|nr:sphingomyelin phosphodiesterase [Vibrio sp. AND4]EDP59010.1 aspartyl-tRNA synthetase [Vibrio sp. AND4]